MQRKMEPKYPRNKKVILEIKNMVIKMKNATESFKRKISKKVDKERENHEVK